MMRGKMSYGRLLVAGALVASGLVVAVGAGRVGAAVPATVSGSMTDANTCTSVLVPALQPPGTESISVTGATDASPEPDGGAPVRLTNSELTFSTPVALLQTAADAGVLRDGFVIPVVVTLVVAASNTTEASHTFTLSTSETVHVLGGVVQPVARTVSLPDTTWHPVDTVTPVVFSEQSFKTVSTLALGSPIDITVVLTLTCTPSTATTIVTVDGRVPAVVPGAVSVVEGNSGTRVVKVPVTLSSAYALRVTVHWTTAFVPGAPAGQADPATDYVAASGIVAFAPGQTSKTVSVTVKGDTAPEPDEYIPIEFSQPTNARMGGFWGIGFAVISNDDAG